MGDVNLLVEVKETGVASAIAELGRLKKSGNDTSSTLKDLGIASEKAMKALSSGYGDLGAGKMTKANKAIKLMTTGVRDLEKEYTRLSKLSIGSSAADRLTRLGGGSLDEGRVIARNLAAKRAAFAADPVKDEIALQKEELALTRQQAREELRLAEARRARASALSGKNSATLSVSRANEDLANQRAGINSVEQAQIRLTRATQDLNQAQAARKATPISTNTAGQIKARTAALEIEARAISGVTVAERELASAQESEKRSSNSSDSNAFQSSYSYFIIAGLANQAAQAIRDFGAASISAASQQQRAFVDVDRTFDGTNQQLAQLKQRLLDLSTTTPVAFADLANIAALGNQLGISAKDIQSFTTTISQYSAVTGQTADASATAFGKISNLTGLAASQYGNLASAIEYTARTTVSTEATISRTATEITALASGAGFSAQAIVGLSGALSSLSIPPERARGALSLYFGALNTAVASGGPKMEAFSLLVGKTSQEIGDLVRQNKGQEIFTSFIAGLSKLDTVAKTSALKELGLSTIRVDQTMRALSQNVPLLTSALAGSDQAFTANTENARQFGKIQETLSSKYVEFQNAIQNAAAAMGGTFNDALIAVLGAVTKLIVGFSEFAQTPIGQIVMAIAGAIGALLFAFTSLVGTLALAKASLVVTKFAFDGLGGGITSAHPKIIQFLAGMLKVKVSAAETAIATDGAAASTKLFGASVAQTAAVSATGAVANEALTVSEEAVGAGAGVAAAGLTTMKVAMATTGIGLLAIGVVSLITAFSDTSSAAKITAGDVAGLSDAIAADTKTYKETGNAVTTYTTKLPKVTSDQKTAAAASKAWANVLGNDLVQSAGAAANAIQKVAAGQNVTEAFRKQLGSNDSVKKIISDPSFAREWMGLGLSMTDFIGAGLKSGGSESKVKSYVDSVISGFHSVTARVTQFGGSATTKWFDTAGNDVTDFYNKLQNLIPTIASTGQSFVDTANQSSVLTSGLDAAGAAGTAADNGFRGAADGLAAYRKAVTSGLSSFSDFGTILQTLQTQQDAANAPVKSAKGKNGPKGNSTSLINASNFSSELGKANDQAVSFFNGLQTLVANGSTEFATQLASLGPAAQGILASALKLDGPAQAKMEENARFAAFLASDAFTAAFKQDMTINNDAYAVIFKQTGSLDAVKAFIAAQVAGTGKEAERQWDAQHLSAPLNLKLINPTPADLDLISKQLSGAITVKATVVPVMGPIGGLGKRDGGTAAGNTFTDTLSGATITLPAELDQSALSASLAYWQKHEGSTPQQIAAALNKGDLSVDLNNWIATHGHVNVLATLVPTNTPASIFSTRPIKVPGVPGQYFRDGGEVNMPHFASGGSWGQFRGPGSGTSDSIMARVSAGEFISTAAATSFWGPDFFDSLNRNMLPTSFLNMLTAATVSGNSGPQSVTHVNVVQNNPLTRDPLKQLRESSEMVAAGIWS